MLQQYCTPYGVLCMWLQFSLSLWRQAKAISRTEVFPCTHSDTFTHTHSQHNTHTHTHTHTKMQPHWQTERQHKLAYSGHAIPTEHPTGCYGSGVCVCEHVQPQTTTLTTSHSKHSCGCIGLVYDLRSIRPLASCLHLVCRILTSDDGVVMSGYRQGNFVLKYLIFN